MTRSKVAGFVAAWLTVVAVGALVVSFVIGEVGRVASTAGSIPAVTRQDRTTTPDPETPTPSATPTRRPRHHAAPRASATPTSRAGALAPSRSAAPTVAPTRLAAPRPRTEVSTRSGTGGTVTVACTGASIALRGATPDDGWRLERGSSGPAEVEVTFLSGQQQVQVQSHCSGGSPVFEVEHETGDT